LRCCSFAFHNRIAARIDPLQVLDRSSIGAFDFADNGAHRIQAEAGFLSNPAQRLSSLA
jgi:hypothetical protein